MSSVPGEYESIPDESFRPRKKDSYDKYLRYGFIIVFLLWGSVLLINAIQSLVGIDNKSDKYQFPDPFITKNGSLKVNFGNLRNNTFNPVLHYLQWIDGPDSMKDDKGLYLTFTNNTYIVKSVYDEDFNQYLLKDKHFIYKGANLTVESLVASPNLELLLIRTNTVSNWRHSSFGSFFVFNIGKQKFELIGDNIALAEWSPNSVDIAYVQDNDLYIYSTKSQRTVKRITQDGSSHIFNGKPDWVYEEEVFETDRSLWWSSTGKYLAFSKIDESKVGDFIIPYYVQDYEDIYPEMRTLKYPKSSTPNPTVDVWIYDTEEMVAYPADINENHEISPILLTEVKWVGEHQLLAKVSDRSSDVLTVLIVNAKKHRTEIVRVNPSNGGWWEISHNIMFVPEDESKGRFSDGYIDIYPVNGFNHLVYFSPSNSSYPVILTKGDWEVVDGAVTFDVESNEVYFIATEKSSTERHLYHVNISNPGKIFEVTDTETPGVYDVSFSSGSRFALLTYKGPCVPFQKIIDLKSEEEDEEVHGNSIGKTLFYLEKNEKLKETLINYAIPSKTFQELSLGTDDNGNLVVVNSFEILPNDFDAKKKDYYPVFFYAYGGPNSQQVIKTFSVGFNEIVASQLGAIVVVVDGRGTGFKGKDFRSIVRDNLGDVEATDQINAAAFYSRMSYVNKEKISLFGWSYGGYLTLKTLEKDAGEYFKYGMSVAPVTDWRYYDSVYTERYMHTIQENYEGYENSKVSNVTAISQAKRFLLMHGTGDDNVHFQNSLKFLDLLDLDSIENYDVHVFPDSGHSIRYHNANTMVYNRLLKWARQAFNGEFLTQGL